MSDPAEHAGLPPSGPAPAGPRSGRGKRLTALEESALLDLCKVRTKGGCFADQPKRFWREVSQAFEKETGRPYSWQSCRRRMTKLEGDANFQHAYAPSPTSPVPAEPSQTTSTFDSTNDESASGFGDDDDVGLPPAVSFVRESLHRQVDPGERAVKQTCISIVNESVENLDIKLQTFGPTVFKDLYELRKVQKAFFDFKNEFDMALEKVKRGQEEGRL
ncbi:hypothetical protein PEBR_08817 [Penicillium brasilianum]|uniref:Uncharacterized protein n=1 Tax=Penicillium brasilianum TaxID=104259 RepID=A0A1S9S332_PENBI|nr:hypothetical protein PEBR_08817 [Penicillium brasilianum]